MMRRCEEAIAISQVKAASLWFSNLNVLLRKLPGREWGRKSAPVMKNPGEARVFAAFSIGCRDRLLSIWPRLVRY